MLKIIDNHKHDNGYKVKYLEIGCEYNQIFNTIPLDIDMKIGVDPFLGGTHRKTSDNFFKDKDINFDLIFIDGLHTYDQCQKDIINSLKFLKPNGIILLHDILPQNSYEEKPHRSGDICKIAVELANSKNINFKIANIDNGVGIVKPMQDFKYSIVENLNNKNYQKFVTEYYKSLPVINCNEALKFIESDNFKKNKRNLIY